MGQDKGSMNINKKPMIIHILSTLSDEIDEAVIVLNNQKRIEKYSEIVKKYDFTYPIKFVEDEIKNKGPISGIMTGLKNISSDYGLVLPCDSPYITKNHINRLFNEISKEYDCIIPYHNDEDKIKTSEPLHGVYSTDNINTIANLIKEDNLNVKGILKIRKTKFLKIENKKEFKNLNYPKDVQSIL